MPIEETQESATATTGDAAPADGGRPRPPGQAAPPGPRAWCHLVTLVVILALAGIAHDPIATFRGDDTRPAYQLLGSDTLQQINSARIESVSDLLGTFTETLTDGRIAAAFYRPLQNLSIALDYALWDLAPGGYHLQSWIVFGLCIVAVYLASRRLLGPASWFGPALAALFYGLHPILLNVVAFPCRRSETLVVLFLMLLLWVLPRRRTGPGLGVLLAGILVLLACGAKELGALGVGLVFLHQWIYAREGSVLQRAGKAALATVPAFTFFGIYMINRTIVVKGLGGYFRPQFESYRDKLTEFLPQLARDFFAPWAWLPGSTIDLAEWLGPEAPAVAPWVLLASLAGVLVLLVLLIALLHRGPRVGDAGRTALLGLALIVPMLPLLGMSQEYYPWYGVIPLAGLALVVAAIGEFAAAGWQAGGLRRGAGVLLGLAVLALVVSPLSSSPLLHDYRELADGSALMKEELDEIHSLFRDAENGRTITLDLIPDQPPVTDQNRPPLRGVKLLSLRGVRSLAELCYPNRRARVTLYAKAEKWRADPGELLIKVRQLIPTTSDTGPAMVPDDEAEEE